MVFTHQINSLDRSATTATKQFKELKVVRTGLEPVPRADSLYQLHKVITPCFTCHVTLRGHSTLPKVSYDHLTPMSSHQYVFSIDLSATCTDACPKQRLGRVDRGRTCTHLLPKQGTYLLVNYSIQKNPKLCSSGFL